MKEEIRKDPRDVERRHRKEGPWPLVVVDELSAFAFRLPLALSPHTLTAKNRPETCD